MQAGVALGLYNNQTNIGNQVSIGAIPTSAPPTIAGSVGQIEDLNARLGSVIGKLYGLASAIGAPTPCAGVSVGQAETVPQGHVNRLRDAAVRCHTQVTEIDDMLDAIGRALG